MKAVKNQIQISDYFFKNLKKTIKYLISTALLFVLYNWKLKLYSFNFLQLSSKPSNTHKVFQQNSSNELRRCFI